MLSDKHRRWVVTLAALAGMALTARLGVWQLDRAAQKQALQRAIESRGRLPALENTTLARDAQAAAGQHYRPVRLRGQWLAQHTVFLDNRQIGGGRPGFFVLTPLVLAPGDAVLVQRGWVPRDAADRTHLPAITTPQGVVEIAGRVAPPPSRLFEFAGAASGPIRQNLDLAAFTTEIDLALRPLSVQQLNAGADAADGLARDWPLPAVDLSKHHGYAFQWFALCALIAGLYVWFQILRPRTRRAA
ncbi:SURF1 family protein [Ideonella sp. BN130291]|uniref:SURF1 family protein n=1 Tax=Ideonella sp. BN130291 TaxID=3112940 RepID=UPI002E275DCD|nr:SURF1 family protein [Ideonella sp. BN130291]